MEETVTAFREYKDFKDNSTFSVIEMYFPMDTVTPPHYADTIEILLYENLEGSIRIGGQEFCLEGKQAFFIAPNLVHSVFYRKCDGKATVMKINVNRLKTMLDMEQIMAAYGKGLRDIRYWLPDYDELERIAGIFSKSLSTIEILKVMLNLLEIMLRNASDSGMRPPLSAGDNNELCNIISWTEKNFQRKITLDEISEFMGYDKHYFCYKFRSATGITYLNYVNRLRLFHACDRIRDGVSVKEVCEECGFENLSYFIQLFKKHMGMTPKQYAMSTRGQPETTDVSRKEERKT